MSTAKPTSTFHLFLLFSTIFLCSLSKPGFGFEDTTVPHQEKELQLEGFNKEGIWGWRRSVIGSTAPTCTYNECRGCRFKCRAEQIPVDANDPINSAYHYRCVCKR